MRDKEEYNYDHEWIYLFWGFKASYVSLSHPEGISPTTSIPYFPDKSTCQETMVAMMIWTRRWKEMFYSLQEISSVYLWSFIVYLQLSVLWVWELVFFYSSKRLAPWQGRGQELPLKWPQECRYLSLEGDSRFLSQSKKKTEDGWMPSRVEHEKKRVKKTQWSISRTINIS